MYENADGTVYFAMAKANGNTDKAFPAVKKFKADNRKPAAGAEYQFTAPVATCTAVAESSDS